MNIKEVVELVHYFGSWQSENCYETIVDSDFVSTNTVLVYNHNTYGTKLEQELCHNTVYLDINSKGMCKINEIDAAYISLHILKKFPWIVDPKYYEEYLIELEEEPNEGNNKD